MDLGLLGQLSGAAVVLVVFLFLSVRIVKEHERMVVFRFGRTGSSMLREPGLRFVIPFVDRPVIAKREQLDEELRASLDEQVAPWGGTVTQVEIREINPPPEV